MVEPDFPIYGRMLAYDLIMLENQLEENEPKETENDLRLYLRHLKVANEDVFENCVHILHIMRLKRQVERILELHPELSNIHEEFGRPLFESDYEDFIQEMKAVITESKE